MPLDNPFDRDGIWLKANLHTHTKNSDGDASPVDRADQYVRAGYDVLALTDHRKITSLEAGNHDGMVLLRGLEAHPPCPNGPVYHLVCLGVHPEYAYDESLPANEIIATVRAGGGIVLAAHPYWCGHTIEHILALEGLTGIEVYNATCGKIGKADSSMFWDYMLAAGRTLPAVAVDDTHSGRDIFMGWTMVRAAGRTEQDVIDALRRGSFYASCGPEFSDFRVDDGGATVTCSPVREIHFVCRGACGRSFYADQGAELTSAAWRPPAAAAYVRAQIVDHEGCRAWTNPIRVG